MSAEALFRLCFAALLFANLLVSASFRRRAHRQSGKIPRLSEDRSLIAIRMVSTLPLLLAMCAYLVAPGWVAFATLPFPTALRWVGVALGTACVPFNYWVFSSIGSNISETVLTKESQQLVTKGPYRWVRHPLYSGALLLLLALSLISANGLIAGLTAMAPLLMQRIICREEAELIGKFGEEYRRYMRSTGQLFPLRLP